MMHYAKGMIMEGKSVFVGYLLAILAVFIWSFNVVVARYFSDTLTPLELSWGRWFFAALALLPFTYKDIWQSRHTLLRQWKLVLSMSVTGIVLMNTFVYVAGHTATAIDMALIGVTGPIFLVALSRIFLKTYVSLTQFMGLIIAVIGVIVLILHGNISALSSFKFVSGDLWMLVSSFVFAFYSMLQAKEKGEIKQTTLLSATIVVGLVILTPFTFLDDTRGNLPPLDVFSVAVLAYMGIFNSVFAYLLWNIALARLGSLKSSSLYYTMPLFSAVEAYFLLGEQLYINQIYGGILVLIGILFAGRHPANEDEIYRP